MTLQLLRRLFGAGRGRDAEANGKHLSSTTMPAAVYAIGDVHGCLDLLRSLEDKIFADGADLPGTKLIVMLGDYIDRGPNSAGVLDHLLAKPQHSFRRICLMGNHEVMASAFFGNPHPVSDWLRFGGWETLQSYGLGVAALRATRTADWSNLIAAHVPGEHLEFLRALPWTLNLPGYLFVHAGLRAGVPLNRQRPEDLFWIREEFFDAEGAWEACVVHGHTPAPEPVVTARRICIDTGAYATGRLTAVKMTRDGEVNLLQTI